VTVISDDQGVDPALGTYLASVLNKLGFKATTHVLSANIQFNYIQNTKNKVQISITQWYQDYPAASDFLHVLLTCGAIHSGSDSSINIAGYCNKAYDKNVDAVRTAPSAHGGRPCASWRRTVSPWGRRWFWC
jgi:peptide/nickel transport system substrate-binding protein